MSDVKTKKAYFNITITATQTDKGFMKLIKAYHFSARNADIPSPIVM